MDSDARQSFLLGVGFDAKDGHKRATKGEDYVLLGGSEETHERMQEGAEKFREALKKRGKRLKDVDDKSELEDLARESGLME